MINKKYISYILELKTRNVRKRSSLCCKATEWIQVSVKSFRETPILGQNQYFSHLNFNHNIIL